MIPRELPYPCDVALKEWTATVTALKLGRQVLLLRKGGLLDPERAFAPEYREFWLAPTRFHQDESLLKPTHRDLLQSEPADRRVLELSSLALVEQTWTVPFEDSEKLSQLPHIWSQNWLDTRFDYQPEKPIIVVAMRVWVFEQPHLVEMQPEYSGCRSWIELAEPLSVKGAEVAVSESKWNQQIAEIRRVLGA